MKRRVVIYARVSTEHEAQISALENQVQYYDEIMKRRPDFELVDRYIDEGITGTSIHKRQSFLRMMEDAKKGKFDLIMTREVSRFARNIVDTLQQTRILKTYGVEVWFTEDNIWTLNDEDGELRLSIMATLAQNESKKISQRVKAGQMISFKNGVLYGNGNILGYRKEGDLMVVEPEQAVTVKRIFELYLEGKGVRKIQDIMEQEQRLTSTGLTHWQAGNINRVLQNPFYCGRIEYRKQYVPDYLTQKKINNHGEIERVYVEGTHEKLVSPEDFDKVQRIIESKRSQVKKGTRNHGKPLADCTWVRKTKCTCGHAMNRRIAYVAKNGDKSYTYQCYDQLHTGTPKSRLGKGLSVEGICDNSTFPEWKLEVQADFIFKKLIKNKQEIYDTAIKMADDICTMKREQNVDKSRVESNIREIDKLKARIASLIDMCADGDISKELFREKKAKIEEQIRSLEQSNDECRRELADNEDGNKAAARMDSLTEFIKMKALSARRRIPETLIEGFVTGIRYDKGVFTWVLNPKLGLSTNELTVDMNDVKKNMQKLMCHCESSTGSDRESEKIKIIQKYHSDKTKRELRLPFIFSQHFYWNGKKKREFSFSGIYSIIVSSN